MKTNIAILTIFFILISQGCKKKDENKFGNELGKIETKADPINVEGVIAVLGDFPLEFVSNGKLVASQEAELYFKKSNIVEKITVKNGDWITKGNIIASLDSDLEKINLLQSEFQVESADLEFTNQMIGYTGGTDKDEMISDKRRHYLQLSSGLKNAELNLEKSKMELANTVLHAPFSGRVADLETKVMNLPESGKPFCRLIDDRKFEVVFPILESEIGRLKVGQAITMRPFIEDSAFYGGNIVEINPVVNEHGLVTVKALVPNNDGKLIQGMNVKVFIKDNVPNNLIVPKEAVVLRNNRQVVFTYSEGKAMWNYQETILENSTSYSIVKEKDGSQVIHPGDTVITIGNLNLAHEAEVKFRMIKK